VYLYVLCMLQELVTCLLTTFMPVSCLCVYIEYVAVLQHVCCNICARVAARYCVVYVAVVGYIFADNHMCLCCVYRYMLYKLQ